MSAASGRTSTTTVTFRHPFSVAGIDGTQPAGTYEVETEAELLPGLSFDAYRRISTTIRLPSPSGEARLDRYVQVDPSKLEAAQESDRQAACAPSGADNHGGRATAASGAHDR